MFVTREVSVKKTAVSFLPLVLIAAMFVSSCTRHDEGANGATTQTIEPAAGQTAPTGTEAMTQTVDIQDGRSEAEGGEITSTTATTVTQTTATTTAEDRTPPSQSRPPERTQE